MFLEESNVSRPSGATAQQVAALFRYDADPRGEKSEPTLVTIRPAGPGRLVILQSPEAAAARARYNESEYEPLKVLR
jgi:hypothetical protein